MSGEGAVWTGTQGAGRSSPAMKHALELCALYARVNRPVVFVGPIGSGKTVLATELARAMKRAGRCVVVGSGELTESLYADALFGHVPGAFTGASSGRLGAYGEAEGGAILLDDLALMPKVVQSAILRVLETKRYRPLGSEKDSVANCRMLFASTVAPGDLVARGDLLADLWSRLGDFVVPVPALRHRKADIMPLATTLARALLEEHGYGGSITFVPEARFLLTSYSWPGNVRELRAVVEAAVVHAGMDQADIEIRSPHLVERVREFSPSREGDVELSRSLVESVVRDVAGNRSEAARRLGVHRNTISRYLKSVS